jgi:hypothetical protein
VTTTTTLAPTTTTTTVPPTLAPPPVAMEFLMDGLGIVELGTKPAKTINTVRDYLGFDPTLDSGWGPAWGDYGACPGTEYRQVRFGGLYLGFSDVDRVTPAGTREFIDWSYDGDPQIDVLSGIDVGMTVADLQSLYPSVTLAYDDLWFGDVFRVEGPVSGQQLWGRLTGPNPGDTIIYLTGGIGCGE